MTKLYDVHCHLDFADNCIDTVRDVDGRIEAISATVVPNDFVTTSEKLSEFPWAHVALGLHPWWVADNRIGENNMRQFEKQVWNTNLIAEIGLDYSGKRKESREKQLVAFERVLQAIKDAGDGKLIFLHAVKSYDDMFNMMERLGTFDGNQVVFHWFQGTPDDFGKALSLGCMFSINMRMMATDAGKIFAEAVPQEDMLLETDNPPHEGMPWSYGMWHEEIMNTAKSMADVRKSSVFEVIDACNANAQALLQEYDAQSTHGQQ